MFKNVLVPYDDSEHAKSALRTALGMVGEHPDACVHVVSIIPVNSTPTPLYAGTALESSFTMSMPVDYHEMMGSILHRTRSDLEHLVEDASDRTVCKTVVEANIATSPVEGIVEYVESNGIDLVVMGRRGLGALRGMLGSVSYGVLRSVEVPVLTVK